MIEHKGTQPLQKSEQKLNHRKLEKENQLERKKKKTSYQTNLANTTIN